MITITNAVYDRLDTFIKDENDESIMGLRVFVQGGGCSGFQYGFRFVHELEEGDTVAGEQDDIKIVVDPMSMMYLDGCTIDYVKGLQGEHISIDNPNINTSCGCGQSFS